jgi:replicative DNA helicase
MIRTGIEGWDAALGGGFVKNNLHIIGAAPGAGKSKLMSYLAKQALSDMKRVVFITLELDEVETLTNICMSAACMSIAELRDLDELDKAIEKIDNFRNTHGTDLYIKFYKPSTVTANTIHNYIQKLIQVKRDKENIDWKPDVIFLDYMDKLLPVDKVKGNIYEDNGGVADDCKNLAIDFNCPVITGSQLGRGSWNLVGNEVISMSSIAESARKAHLAHSLTTINANPQEKELGKARLYLAKSRSGSTGKVIYMNHNLLRNKFSECKEGWTQEQLSGATSFTIRDTNNGSKK